MLQASSNQRTCLKDGHDDAMNGTSDRCGAPAHALLEIEVAATPEKTSPAAQKEKDDYDVGRSEGRGDVFQEKACEIAEPSNVLELNHEKVDHAKQQLTDGDDSNSINSESVGNLLNDEDLFTSGEEEGEWETENDAAGWP